MSHDAPDASHRAAASSSAASTHHAVSAGAALPTSRVPNFDEVVDRTGSGSLKWDRATQRGMPADVLPLWVADMDMRTPEVVTQALVDLARNGVLGYTEPTAAYERALATWLSKRHHWDINPRWNIVTPGVVVALACAVRAYTQPGDSVVIMEPVYYPFREVIEDNGRVVASCPLIRDGNRYRMDVEGFERCLADGATLFILCNPHNPVGRVWSAEELLDIGRIASRYGVTVVADEIHADITYPGHATTLFASLSPELAALSVTCTAPTKTFNLAGLQIANILIPDDARRTAFAREVQAMGYSQPNAAGLAACRAAYEGGIPWLEAFLAYLEDNRTYARARLTSAGFTLVEPEGTYLLWVDCRDVLALAKISPADLDSFVINEARLWLDDGVIFGAGGHGHTRINIACPRSTLAEAFDRLEAALSVRLRGTAKPESDSVNICVS